MNKPLLLILIFIVSLSACKDETEPVIDAEIIGKWKRISYITITGTDSVFSDYSETIYHYYNSDGTYDETKSGNYTANANYEYSYDNNILKLFSMGNQIYEYTAVITGNTMIIDIDNDGTAKYSYKLYKE